MNQRIQPSAGIARFVPGVALLKGFSMAMPRTELVAAVTVFAIIVIASQSGKLLGISSALIIVVAAIILSAVFNLL